MLSSSANPSLRRGAGLALLAALAGCETFAPVGGAAPQAYLDTTQPGLVAVTRRDQSVVLLSGPHMVGDTVVGVVNRELAKIPLSEITGMAAPRLATAKTIAFIAAGAVAVGGGMVLLMSQFTGHPGADWCEGGGRAFSEVCE